MQDFAGSKVDRNLPSSEEDASSIPGLEDSQTLEKLSYAQKILSPCAATMEA